MISALNSTVSALRAFVTKLGVTADGRISTWGSYVSNGAGGSCFGKDIQSLIYQLNRSGRSTDMLQAVYNINEYQKTYLIDRAVHEAGFSFNNKSVALLGLAAGFTLFLTPAAYALVAGLSKPRAHAGQQLEKEMNALDVS